MKSVFYLVPSRTAYEYERSVTLLRATHAPLPRVIQIAALAVVHVERRLVSTLIFCYFFRLFGGVEDAGRVADPIIIIPWTSS